MKDEQLKKLIIVVIIGILFYTVINNINVVLTDTKKDAKLANNIIRSIQDLYDKDMYITVKFN